MKNLTLEYTGLFHIPEFRKSNSKWNGVVFSLILFLLLFLH